MSIRAVLVEMDFATQLPTRLIVDYKTPEFDIRDSFTRTIRRSTYAPAVVKATRFVTDARGTHEFRRVQSFASPPRDPWLPVHAGRAPTMRAIPDLWPH